MRAYLKRKWTGVCHKYMGGARDGVTDPQAKGCWQRAVPRTGLLPGKGISLNQPGAPSRAPQTPGHTWPFSHESEGRETRVAKTVCV